MKLILSAAMLSLALTNVSFANDERAAFKSALETVANRTLKSPLKCVVTPFRGIATKVSYKLSLKEESNYEEAFFLTFSETQTDENFSTLIAYEGLNHFQLGELKVSVDQEDTIYAHTFDGFLKDVVTVTMKDSKMKAFSYDKINPQGIKFLSMVCK